MLSCLLVVGTHSLVFTDLRRKGACNQGKGSLRVVKYQFTRRHSFCNFYQECTLPRFSRNRQKKTSSSDKVSFISPLGNLSRLGLNISNQRNYVISLFILNDRNIYIVFKECSSVAIERIFWQGLTQILTI